MSSDDRPPPDFATLRAVEILASLAERNRETRLTPPPPIDRPVILFNETLALALGTTSRRDVQRSFGRGAAYPAAGWWTYALRFGGSRRLLSVIFRADRLSGVELYLPKVQSVPDLKPNFWGDFRLVPGDVAIGAAFATLDARFTPAVGGPGRVMYENACEIRFPGGLGYVIGNAGVAERLVLYAADP
ncbi:MAG: hypothetical protein ABSB70_09095 [Candidatus Velthaea sp.]|jgi:hypothetical protein